MRLLYNKGRNVAGKKKTRKIPEIIRESVLIVPADYLPGLSTINCRKIQSILLVKIKMVSVRRPRHGIELGS